MAFFFNALYTAVKNAVYAMKTIGIILIALGIIMLVVRGISYTTEKKVVDIGPLEVNKKDKKTVGWPMYAGGIAVVAGIVLVLADRKKA
jgi:hypothetical protein